MPKRVPPLSELQIRHAKKRDAPCKLFDGGGLYLEVSTAGTKQWRLQYRRPNGKENKLHLGAYPEVTLAQAHRCWGARRQHLSRCRDAVWPFAPGRARG